jgi:hypothetical protein
MNIQTNFSVRSPQSLRAGNGGFPSQSQPQNTQATSNPISSFGQDQFTPSHGVFTHDEADDFMKGIMLGVKFRQSGQF